MDERNEQLKTVSNRLVWSLAVLVAVGVSGGILAAVHHGSASTPVSTPVPTPLAVLFVGFIGGFVGLQRRLKALPPEDLTLLANSWVCIALSPIAGAILAVLVFLIFCSGLLGGNLFPAFVPDNKDAPIQGLQDMFAVHCASGADYAKVLFWSFIAGFSERFATNIIGQFESKAAEAGLSQTQQKKPEDGA